ncbi:MAG: hypothetical protein AAGU77_06325 [Bacillota bacterium]
MKKYIALALALLLAFSLVGCSGNAKVKTGLAVITSISSSKDATADAEGNAQADSVVVAVTVDASGKIVACKLDTAQSKVAVTADGKISTPLDTEFKTKQELGTDYGMKGASGIGKEWYEQADAFAAYCVGKTVDQIKGIAVNEEGAPADAELASSVTMHVTSYIDAVAKAVENAKDLGAKASDTLGLGVSTSIDKSTEASADAAGNVQFYSNYTATTLDKSGKITSCAIDASQTNIGFDTTGKITTDLASEFKTKNELGYDYNMKGVSGIGKEWFEQAESLAQYVTGKTIDQVKGIAVNEEGAPTDAELTSSVTVQITDMLGVIEKAAVNAK